MPNLQNCCRFVIPGWRWLMFYCVMSLIINWPLVGSMTTHISYGHETEITVPLLNVWTIWWNADRATRWMQGYWDAPIFFPTQKTFAFSEAQPTSLIVSPILWLTSNRALTYNCYQLLIFTLNGYSAHRLFRRLGHIRWLAMCGGILFQILPFVTWQFGVVQSTTLFGINWTIHSLLDLFGTGLEPTTSVPSENGLDSSPIRPKSALLKWVPLPFRQVGIQLGFAYGVTYWLCNYWGLFLTLVLIPSSLVLWNRRLFQLSFWGNVAIASLIACAMIGPFAWLQHQLSRAHDWPSARTDEMIESLSSHWRDHTDTPWLTNTPWLEFPEKERENIWPLGGGGLKLLLVPVGLIAASLQTRRRRWGLFALVFGALSFGLSLGPTVRFQAWVPGIGGTCPYDILKENFPGFSLIRSPFRFALFVQIAAVWLSIEALDLMNPNRWQTRISSPLEGLPGRLRTLIQELFQRDGLTVTSVAPLIPLLIASICVTTEVLPPVTRLYKLNCGDDIPLWVIWLRDHADPNTAVACLPFPMGYQASDYEETTLLMYWGTFHGRPLLNGYSGFFPTTFFQIKEGLEQFQRPAGLQEGDAYNPRFSDYLPDNPGLRLLNETDARYVVMKRAFGNRDEVWSHPQTRFRWAHVASDELEQVDIYELPSRDE